MGKYIDLEEVVKKDILTVDDLGRLLITNNTIVKINADGGQSLDLLDTKNFMTSYNNLKTEEDLKKYGRYGAFYIWLEKAYGTAATFEQNAWSSLNKLESTFVSTSISEEILAYVRKLPLILTESAYKEFVANGGQTDRPIAVIVCNEDQAKLSNNLLPDGNIKIVSDLKDLMFPTFDFYAMPKSDKSFALSQGVVENIQELRRSLACGYKLIQGFNYIVDATADIYNIPLIRRRRMDVELLHSAIDTFNKKVDKHIKMTKVAEYPTTAEKRRKLKALKEVFYPIPIDSYKIPKENKIAGRQALEDLSTFDTEILAGERLGCLFYY